MHGFYFEYIITPARGLGAPDETAVKRARSLFHASASVLDSHLAQHALLVADTPSIADFTVAVNLFVPGRRGRPGLRRTGPVSYGICGGSM